MSPSPEKKSTLQFIKFALIGVSNTLVDYGVTFALNVAFGLFVLARIIGYICGVANSYFWNSRWTFREERRRDTREILSFLIVNLVTLGISVLLQLLFRDVLHLGDWWIGFAGENWLTKLLNVDRFCMLLAFPFTLIVNFIGNKLFVFGKREETTEAEDRPENTEE